MANGLIGVVAGIYLAKLGQSPAAFGVVLAAGVAGTAVAAAGVTFWGDRFGRRRGLIAVAIASAAGGAVIAVASDFALLAAAAFLGMMNSLGKDRAAAMALEQAILPGTVDDVLRPRIERESGKKSGTHFHVCFQPEFLREGSSIRDYDNPPFTIVGASADEPVRALQRLLGHLPCDFHATSIRAAEMIKYCCNNFHALKITFANETARLCEALGVDPFEVMDLVCRDTQLNISRAYLRPGFAFGGSCLPKDLRATAYLAKTRDVELPMLRSILESNRVHIDHAIAKILASGKRRVGMIGLSFKTGTDDLRESPLVTLAEHLIGKGLSLLIYDPEVHLSRLLGANRRFIEEHVPHIGSLMRGDLESVIDESDVLVVGLSEPRVLAAVRGRARASQIVVDLVSIPDRSEIAARYVGLCWP